MKQSVLFVEGAFGGKIGEVDFPDPFFQGMEVDVNFVEKYIVARGPIAEAIEKTQKPFDSCVVRLVAKSSMTPDELRKWTEFMEGRVHPGNKVANT